MFPVVFLAKESLLWCGAMNAVRRLQMASIIAKYVIWITSISAVYVWRREYTALMTPTI